MGTSHEREGSPCQDASVCAVVTTEGRGPVLVAVACDGAGSALRGGDGARIASRAFHDAVVAGLEGPEPSGDWSTAARDLVRIVLASLEAAAQDAAADVGDFACTLVGAIVEKTRARFVQVGDGVIVVSEADRPGGYEWVFWPDNGEYENETTFVTSPDIEARVQSAELTRAIDEVALLTDGLQRVALRLAPRLVHAPFFEGLFRLLRSAPEGRAEEFEAGLALFLSSDRVNERTNDDKTLFLATRLGAGAPVDESMRKGGDER